MTTYDWRWEYEERILSDCLTYGEEAITAAATAGLRPKHLNDAAHQRIYAACLEARSDWARVLPQLDDQDTTMGFGLVDWEAPDQDVAASIMAWATKLIFGEAPRWAVPKDERFSLTNSRYGDVAIQRITDDLRDSPTGQRNERLNRSAYAAAKLVRDGHAQERDVDHLRVIAQQLGLPKAEVDRTWRSGWQSGWAS